MIAAMRIFGALLIGAAAAGCGSAPPRVPPQPPRLAVGESEADVRTAWGPPQRVAASGSRAVWYYDRPGGRVSRVDFVGGQVAEITEFDMAATPARDEITWPGAPRWPKDSSARRDGE